MNVDDGEAQRPVVQVVPHAGLHRRDVLLRHRAAGDRVGERKALAAGARFDLHHHIAELAVPAGLLLVAATHLGSLADRLAVGDMARARPRGDAELRQKPLQSHPEVDFALAPQHHLVRLDIVVERQRGVFLDELRHRAGELHLVFAVRHGDGEPVDRRGAPPRQKLLRRLAGGERFARRDAFKPPQRDGGTQRRRGDLPRLAAHHREQSGDARLMAFRAMHDRAVGEFALEDAGERQLAAVGGVNGFHHLRDGARLVARQPQPRRGLRDTRRLVAQRLEQPQDAVAVLG